MERIRSASQQTKKVLALLLSQRARWLHGYELSDQTGLKSGTLYPILMRLADRGMLESRWEPSPHHGRPPRKLYRLTALGASSAAEHSKQRTSTRLLLSPRPAR
jgi:PadR family transcriptional regulator, regulatory protein PadR